MSPLEADQRITFGRLRRRWLFLVMRWVLRRFGFDSARPIGTVFGALQYFFSTDLRRRCLEGVAAVLGRKPDDPEVACTVRTAFVPTPSQCLKY